MKTWIPALIVIVLVVVGYLGYTYGTTGNVSVYVQDAPSGFTVYLTVTSIMLHQVNGSWIEVSNKTVTFALTSNLTLLASARIPSGKYNEVFLYVSNATASISGFAVTIPSKVFKIHFVGGNDLVVGPTENAQVIISFPHFTVASGSLIISPSVTAQAVN